MATVVFDFDSTLISVESLDVLRADRLESPELREQLGRINREGMEGRRSFKSSLRARLELARPTREEMSTFGEGAWRLLTPGMEELIGDLHGRGHAVWIVSGAAREVILPLAARLAVPVERVRAVEFLWDENGELLDLAEENPILEGKWRALEGLSDGWERPRFAVGDGITDWELRERGCVDTFIAFTEHVRRDAVLERCDRTAGSASELRALLEETC